MMHALKGDLAAADELWGTLSDGLLAQPLFAGGQFVVRAHHHLLHASFDALAKEVARVADMPFSERYRAAREAFAARVALARGEREQALQGARHAVEVLDATHCMRVDLHHAGYAPAIDVLAELDHEAARRVAAEQARRLRDLAAEMNDAELRAGFLGAVPWNRRTLAQAAAWGLPADP
jgi:hypothetical protein